MNLPPLSAWQQRAYTQAAAAIEAGHFGHATLITGPALIGLVTHARTCKPLSLHRTWIKATGKADVSPSRMPLASHSLADGVIRLWPDEAVTHGLGVAEGIETKQQLKYLQDLDCDIVQGYFFSKPLPEAEATLYLEKNLHVTAYTSLISS